jgi:hypothetical protein
VCQKQPTEVCKGAPTHVQVMRRPMMDEELIGVVKVVERVLKENV